jgi:DNA-binding NarL/FixJ family response regulator
MPTKIDVVIADDEELFRVGLVHILTRDEAINVTFQASDGLQLLKHLANCKTLPDIVITDIKMPNINGVEATKVIREKYKEIGIIALTTYNTKPFIRNMIDVGASAYLVKNSPPSKVLHTIKQVYYNGFYYDTKTLKVINETAISRMNVASKTAFDKDFLTEREREILHLICLQLTSSEISEKLIISKRTVETHRQNIIEKTEVKNLAGLVIFAIQNNLVPSTVIE